LRGWVALGVPPALQLRTLAFVWAIDAALAPIGLLAAFASADWRFAFLGVLPLAGLLVVLSRERARRLATELAASRARDSLIADASHELQTPLAVLSGLIASLGREPGALSERNAGRQAAMERQAGQLRFLVGQFVDYARIKAGQELSLAQRSVSVGPLLHGVAELWRPEVDVQLPGGAWDELAVFADEARLHRVLMSLVANAVKHGSPDGPVWLSAQVEGGDRVLITVVDHGPGMSAELREVAFDELRLIDDEGMGVGLFVTRANLRAQGGEIVLQEAAGGGLVAEVRVPAVPG
jgi:signal transduction histidine kinase